jgi:protoheme IX farnesyltransferase
MQEIICAEAPRSNRNIGEVVLSYYQLTKPRIIVLLLITTVGAMWIAAAGQVDPLLLIVTVVGGALASASANAINCLYDRDIDFVMERTRLRPIPSGRVSPRDALLFAIVLAMLSFSLLYAFANLLAAGLAMSGIATYVGIYTCWLKRSSTQNIVIGGAAGAIPPLVGWASVTGELSWAAWALFAIIFFWTPPHFWALALMIRDEYAKVGVPMLPVVVGDKPTTKQILIYSILLLPISLLLVYPLHVMGVVYAAFALCLGGNFIFKSWQLGQAPSDRTVARSVFKYSILYLMFLCVGMAIDSLPITHLAIATLSENFQSLASHIPLLS